MAGVGSTFKGNAGGAKGAVKATCRRVSRMQHCHDSRFRIHTMPIYIYETTDPSKPVRRFEVKQSMRDEPLRVDPKTGEAVKRVISGGIAVHVSGGGAAPAPKPRGGCGPG